MAFRVLLGLVIIAVLLRQGGRSSAHLRLDARALAGGSVAVVMLTLALLLSAVRWKLVLGPTGPRTRTLFRYYLIGWFFSLFLPTSVGGDAVRGLAVGRSARAGVALSSIVVERLLGVAALVFYLLLGLVLAPSGTHGQLRLGVSLERMPLMLGVGLLLGAMSAVAARRIPRVGAIVREAMDLLRGFHRSRLRLTGALVISLIVQGTYVLIWYDLAASFGLHVPLKAFLVDVPLVSLAAMLPITVAGLGVREGAWALLLAPAGIAAANAVRFSLAYYACGLVVGLAGGVLFALSGSRAQHSLALTAADEQPRASAAAARQVEA